MAWIFGISGGFRNDVRFGATKSYARKNAGSEKRFKRGSLKRDCSPLVDPVNVDGGADDRGGGFFPTAVSNRRPLGGRRGHEAVARSRRRIPGDGAATARGRPA